MHVDFNSMVTNVRRAMSLDRAFYQEVAEDERYNREALMVVVVAAALTGIGGFLGSLLLGNPLRALLALVAGIVMAVAGYYVWAYLVQILGKAMFQGQATAPQLLRTLGYAYGATALGVLSFVPCIGWIFALGGGVWSLVCGFFAVRETHRIRDGQAIVTVLVGWLVVGIISAALLAVLGVGAVGMNAIFGG